MADAPEPKWIDLTMVNSPWEQQLNENAPPGSSDEVAYRHRLARAPGQTPDEWKPGEPPH